MVMSALAKESPYRRQYLVGLSYSYHLGNSGVICKPEARGEIPSFHQALREFSNR